MATCAILLLSSGCFLHKKPPVVTPVAASPPPVALVPPPPPPPATLPEPVLPAPAPLAPLPPAPVLVQSKPSPLPPALKTPPARRHARPGPVPVAPAPAPAPVPVTPAPAPSLGTILTPDRRRILDAAYRTDLLEANKVLDSLKGRALTPEQVDTVNRARAFIREAAQYHDRDLTTAAELARRARVLTQDLAGTH